MSFYTYLREIVNTVGLAYARFLCRREYLHRQFCGVNERPVEYAFVFKCLTRIWPINVLDIGTGQSSLPHLMSTCGFLVTAIDKMGQYWRYPANNRHYHIIYDDITATHLIDEFDLITCISVLEHIQEHDQAVQSMFSLLKPGGHLILTFPYNDHSYHGNVYDFPGSTVIEKPHFITQAFSRSELEGWLSANQAAIVDQEFWRFYTGDYWTCGERVQPPEQVSREMPHQVTCLLIRKGVAAEVATDVRQDSP